MSTSRSEQMLLSMRENGNEVSQASIAERPRKRKKTSRSENDERQTATVIKDEKEKRLRRYRAKTPVSFSIIYQRATEQRFYILNRERCGTPDCPEEKVEIAGSTGNIYTVHIALVPSCNCPHALKGNQCKHIIYVMSRVLRARFELVYQLALLSTELREIFEKAPPIIGRDDGKGKKRQQNDDPNRKAIEGDCPICFTPFDDGDDAVDEEIVYCRATCGQNMHKECFDMWARTKRAVTCPMCRSPWQGGGEEDDAAIKKNIKNTGVTGEDGYVNVADQLGLSGIRDGSTYYRGPRSRGDFYFSAFPYPKRRRRR